jgi:NMD protein affecting ribosome stability and mRNA decay
MTNKKVTGKTGRPQPRRERRSRRVPDAERATKTPARKPAETRVCASCGLIVQEGRWLRGPAPTGSVHLGLCPACERIKEKQPGGTIRIHAGLIPYREEIEGMISHAEAAESAEHPLERLMAFEETRDGLVVTTTGIHLARLVANKLRRRFHGKLKVAYKKEEALFQVDAKAQ